MQLSAWSWRSKVPEPLSVDETIGRGVAGTMRDIGEMATVKRLEPRGEQLELAPRVGLNEPLLRPAEAAALLSVRTSWIYEAVRSGRLPHLRVGRHIRFTRSDLERWASEQRVTGRRA